jgi:hypothetical protein
VEILQRLRSQPFKTSGTLQYTSAEDWANYVEWAIPAEDEEPSPFTWASVDETDSDRIVSISLIFVDI